MSYTTGTTHYNLPQTVGTDKRDWADTNQAFQDIDAAIYGAVQDVAQAASDVDALEARMDTAEQNISTNTGDIAGLDTRMTTAEGAITSMSGQITDIRQDLEDMICAYNEASATSTHAYEIGDYFIYNDVLYKATQAIAIGDTIVPDTNCATTNVTTELLATVDLSGDVTQLQTDVAQLQTDVGDIQDFIGDNFNLLWNNPDTSVGFPEQTLTLDLSEYKAICIMFTNWTGSSAKQCSCVIPVGRGSEMLLIDSGVTTAVQIVYRYAVVISTGIEFSTGAMINSSGNSGTDDKYALPRYIYGIR